ncbi:MAG: helix-turn-helix domain-containing protein [Gemmatimonadota bacterium]
MTSIDLTPFGFTPTESRVYEVLLTAGPGTGYAIARSAGLARANAYSALEGLVAKGAARAADGHPKQFRPEPPTTLLAKISNQQGQALEVLGRNLETLGAPSTPSMTEISSPRGALQLLTHEIGRAASSVLLIAPAEAYPLLTPALRRAVSAGLRTAFYAQVPVVLPFVRVESIISPADWPGLPLIAIVDDRNALVASREGAEVMGHWSGAPSFVAAARLAFERLRGPA